MIHHVDADGTSYPKAFDFYSFNASAATHRGTLLYQLDFGDPGYVAIRVPSNPIFNTAIWAHQQRGNPSAPIEFELHDPTTGQDSWWTIAQMEALTGRSGNGGSSNVVTASGEVNPAFASLGQYRGSLLGAPFLASVQGPFISAVGSMGLTSVGAACYYEISPSECD